MRFLHPAHLTLKSLALVLALAAAQPLAAEVLAPANQRFATADVQEEPSYQRHVLPLMGRLGCNGRACHGSFQGQGGFRLSLFGFDFEADHKALLDEKNPRVDVKNPLKSLILEKPSTDDKDEHGGGKRFAKGSWQYQVLRRWIETGAKNDCIPHAELTRLEVQPAEIQFRKPGETVKLRAVAVWSNGVQEDVTPICRFQSNDSSLAEVSVEGDVKCMGRGDTHVVVFYDNGITPVPVMLPISEKVAANYPKLPTPTKIDELVSIKHKKLGIIPADLCTDTEFLRRVSVDITGTLPAPEEIQAFVADAAADKRARKIDELLERPAYAAWWTTRLCDITGNNSQFMGTQAYRDDESRQWYNWIFKRVSENKPYSELVAGIVMATGRKTGQSYEDYCQEMGSYFRKENRADFANRETMPHFWSRRNIRTSEEKALGFSYAFLGVRLQCAQCHKHPFDQWSKQDFDQFTAFFNGVKYGVAPQDNQKAKEMKAALAVDPKVANQNNETVRLLNEGKKIPFDEVYVTASNNNYRRDKDQKKGNASARVITPKVLGGEAVVLEKYGDPRQALLEWMEEDDNPYFARAWVNRVWSNYFNVGIVEPADDMNLANPPSNAALLDWLTREFVAHKYDMKWLHRTIANSLAYQRSWHANDTNRLDDRNFARAVPRRLPAEVVLDAISQATAGEKDVAAFATNVNERAIGSGGGLYQRTPGRGASSYALLAFGKPARSTNCDCERSMEPSLLQTLYLRNDNEMLGTIERSGGWLSELGKQHKVQGAAAAQAPSGKGGDAKDLTEKLAKAREKLKRLDPQKNADEVKVLKNREKYLTEQLAKTPKSQPAAPAAAASPPSSNDAMLIEQHGPALIRQAYLRTLSRLPADNELHRSLDHLRETKSLTGGLRDLVWALINTKEFIVNH